MKDIKEVKSSRGGICLDERVKGRIYGVSKIVLLADCFSDREKPRRSRSEEQERGMNMGHFKCHPDGDFITLFYTLMHISIRK